MNEYLANNGKFIPVARTLGRMHARLCTPAEALAELKRLGYEDVDMDSAAREFCDAAAKYDSEGCQAIDFALRNPAPRAKPLDFGAARQRQGKLLSLKGEPDQTTVFPCDGFEPM